MSPESGGRASPRPLSDVPARRDAVFDAVRAVVVTHFAEESESLDALFAWWAACREVPLAPDLLAGGLAAIGHGGEDRFAPLLLLAFSAIISEWPERQGLPTAESVEAALRAGASHLGLRGAKLQRVVEVSKDKLCAVLNRLENPTRSPRFPVAPPEVLWVEELKAGKRAAAKEITLSEYPALADLRDVRLVVDEHGGRWRGKAAWRPIESASHRETASVWLALRFTGESFGYPEIEDVRWLGGNEPSGRRRFPSDARKVLNSLIGAEVLPRGKGKRYRVPVDGWSWRWIRVAHDPIESRLLRQFRGPLVPTKG